MIKNIFAIDLSIEQLDTSTFLTIKRIREVGTGKKEALQILDEIYNELKKFIINRIDESIERE